MNTTAKGHKMSPILLKIEEVSSKLNVSKSTIRSWIHQGKIPVTRLGRAVRIRSDIVEMIIVSGLRNFGDQEKNNPGAC